MQKYEVLTKYKCDGKKRDDTALFETNSFGVMRIIAEILL